MRGSETYVFYGFYDFLLAAKLSNKYPFRAFTRQYYYAGLKLKLNKET